MHHVPSHVEKNNISTRTTAMIIKTCDKQEQHHFSPWLFTRADDHQCTVCSSDIIRHRQVILSVLRARLRCRRHKSVARRYSLRHYCSIAILVTARLGVLILISYLCLLCFSLGWLLAVGLLIVCFFPGWLLGFGPFLIRVVLLLYGG